MAISSARGAGGCDGIRESSGRAAVDTPAATVPNASASMPNATNPAVARDDWGVEGIAKGSSGEICDPSNPPPVVAMLGLLVPNDGQSEGVNK